MCPEPVSPGLFAASSSAPDPREQVSLASRVLALAGNADLVWGHVSVRDPGGRGVWMKAAGWGLEEIDPSRVVLVGFDGSLLAGDGPVHIEYYIHTEIMRARPEVGSVVHTHAPAAVSFAALDRPLLPISHEGCLFTPPDIPRFTESGALIASEHLGRRLAAVVGDRNAALIPAHGLVALGADAPLAVMTSLFLDRACQFQLPVEAAGGPARWSDAEEARVKLDTCCAPSQLMAGWRYLARRAGAGSTEG